MPTDDYDLTHCKHGTYIGYPGGPDYMCGRCEMGDDDCEYDEDEELIDGVGFAQEGSALRAATATNPRNLPCPNCGTENVLTPIDRQRGYQCDACANAAERGY